MALDMFEVCLKQYFLIRTISLDKFSTCNEDIVLGDLL